MLKFINFIKRLKTKENSQLLETIEHGFNMLFEAPSSDDANAKQLGQAVGKYGVPADSVNFKQNENNEYFPQTLPKEMIKSVLKAQSGGKKVRLYPDAGRDIISFDPLKSGQGRSDNANIDSGEWAGDSGGYNLGGP